MQAGDAMPSDPDVSDDVSFPSCCTKGPGMGKSIQTGRGAAAGAGGERMGSAPEGSVFLGGVMKCGIG